MNIVEIVGYIAMLLLVISFLPKNIKLIRGINFAGCAFFVVYGIMLGFKWPIIISNGMIACIHLYHLFGTKAAAES